MYLDNGTKYILKILKSAGFAAYAVGGCVRDTIMGRPVSDYDITTPSSPDETERVLSENNIRFVETGLKHGTVTAVIDGKLYEITSFRTECGYSDNRRPDKVTFVTDVKQDLSRRDFTVNAMAYNYDDGLIDLFGGRKDIEDKVIRTVGDPDLRFTEDALRILRALRFASVLGFDIDESTAHSINKNAHLLSNIADERITAEMLKLLEGNNFLTVFKSFPAVFVLILPITTKIYEKHAFNKFADMYVKLPKQAEYTLMLMGVMCCNKKLEIHAQLGRLKLPNLTRNRILSALEVMLRHLPDNKIQIKLTMSAYGRQAVEDAAVVLDDKKVTSIIKEIIVNNEPYLISQLDIDGKTLMTELGVYGREIGDCLQKALKLVIIGEIGNEKEQIIKALRK